MFDRLAQTSERTSMEAITRVQEQSVGHDNIAFTSTTATEKQILPAPPMQRRLPVILQMYDVLV